MKRSIVAFFLFLTLVLCGGCNDFAAAPLRDTMPLPADGIVSQEVMAQIQDEQAIAVLTGTSGEYRYAWTVFGSDIKTPRAVCLALEFDKTQDAQSVAFSFGATGELGCTAVLSITVPTRWDAQSATVCAVENGEKTALCGASVTGSHESTLNFSVSDPPPHCLIVADAQSVSADSEAVTSAPQQQTTAAPQTTHAPDDYLSAQTGHTADPVPFSAAESDQQRVLSDGKATAQDKYLTDPIPAGKPMPVEPDEAEVDDTATHSCTFSIECAAIFGNLDDLNEEKREVLPSDGVLLSARTVSFLAGESVFDVLQRLCRENGIHMEASWTPIYNSAYVEGIGNLYEFDCGELSGWMYRVNGWYPNYGCSRYALSDGDVVEWRFTCDLGRDVGCDWMAGGE